LEKAGPDAGKSGLCRDLANSFGAAPELMQYATGQVLTIYCGGGGYRNSVSVPAAPEPLQGARNGRSLLEREVLVRAVHTV
jgi:hypothetical protein